MELTLIGVRTLSLLLSKRVLALTSVENTLRGVTALIRVRTLSLIRSKRVLASAFCRATLRPRDIRIPVRSTPRRKPVPGSPKPVHGIPKPVHGSPKPVPGSPKPVPGSPKPVPGSPELASASSVSFGSDAAPSCAAKRRGGCHGRRVAFAAALTSRAPSAAASAWPSRLKH